MNRKTFNLILILFYFIEFISSDDYIVNQDGETCRNASPNPDNEYECTSYNTEDTACCFATIEEPNGNIFNKCIPVPKDARFALNYLTIFSFEDYDGHKYEDVTANFQCGQTEGFCGMDSPEKIFQCSEHSSTTRSCCYLTTPTYTECVLSSEKYNKETKFDLFGDSTVICHYDKIKIKTYNLLFYLALLIPFL